MAEAIAHLHLRIETGSEPIAGSVATPGQEPLRFDGWIELVAAIERARAGGVGSLAFTIPRPIQ